MNNVALEKAFALIEKFIPEDECFVTGPVGESMIDDAEKKIGLVFGYQYRQLLEKYGMVAFFGVELCGLNFRRGFGLSFPDVVWCTLKERERNLALSMIVIYYLGDGGIVCLDSVNGQIVSVELNGHKKFMYSCLGEFLLDRFTQAMAG